MLTGERNGEDGTAVPATVFVGPSVLRISTGHLNDGLSMLHDRLCKGWHFVQSLKLDEEQEAVNVGLVACPLERVDLIGSSSTQLLL